MNLAITKLFHLLSIIYFCLLIAGCNLSDDQQTKLNAYDLSADKSEEVLIAEALSTLHHKVEFSSVTSPVFTLAEQMQKYNVPGISITVIDNYEIAWSKAFGIKENETNHRVTTETLFHAKSLSKPVAALIALKLVDQGLLNLNTPLRHQIRSWRIPNNTYTKEEEPTLRHLLSHSAGFTRWGVDAYQPDEDTPTLLESLQGEGSSKLTAVDINYVPGSQWRYSGGGYGVLQLLLEEKTGKSFSLLADSLVFTPLNMDHSLFTSQFPSSLKPFAASGHETCGEPLTDGYENLPIQAAGGLWSTANDMAKFLIAVKKAWAQTVAEPLLSQKIVSEMLKRQINGWGLGFKIEQHEGYLHISHTGSGGGFKALMAGYPELGSGIVILLNGEQGGKLRFQLARSIAEKYNWPGYKMRTYDLYPLDKEELQSYAGTYKWEYGGISKITITDDQLISQFENNDLERLFPVEKHQFLTYDNDYFTFFGGPDNRDSLLLTNNGGLTFEASKIR